MVFAALTVALAMGASCQVSSPAQMQVLVELYTSQGCSSCPPADRWLSQLDPGTTAGVIPLALHVGYWDYIGWKDPYARRDFNARQQWLAGINRNRTVYTPGVFVQARETPRWYEASTFAAAVRAIGAQPARAKIDLAVERNGTDEVQVRADAALAPQMHGGDAKLFVALTESGIDTRVKAGENRGATLRNDHVARDWSGPLALGKQSIALHLAPTAAGTVEPQRAVVAVVQDVNSGEVLQAVRLPLAACMP